MDDERNSRMTLVRRGLRLGLFGWLAIFFTCGLVAFGAMWAWRAKLDGDERRAIAAIREAGGSVDEYERAGGWLLELQLRLPNKLREWVPLTTFFTVSTSHDCSTDASLLTVLENLRSIRNLYLVAISVGDNGSIDANSAKASQEEAFAQSEATARAATKLRELPRSVTMLTLRWEGLTDASLANIAHLSRLETLTVNSSGITGDGLRHLASMSELAHIDLAGTSVTDNGLTEMPILPNVRYLSVHMGSLRNAGLARVAELPNLETLYLIGGTLSDDMASTLARMKSLISLSIEDAALGDSALAALASMSGLEYLDLQGCQLPSQGWSRLQPAANLRSLVLSRTNVGDDAIRNLIGMSSLGYLELNATLVTDACIDDLAAMKGSKIVHLYDTRTTPAGRHRLNTLRPGLVVHADK